MSDNTEMDQVKEEETWEFRVQLDLTPPPTPACQRRDDELLDPTHPYVYNPTD